MCDAGGKDADGHAFLGFCLPAKALQLATGLLAVYRLPLVLDLDDTLVLAKTRHMLVKEKDATEFQCGSAPLTPALLCRPAGALLLCGAMI